MKWGFHVLVAPCLGVGLFVASNPASGSRQKDSLMMVVDGSADHSARVDALLQLAREREHLRPGESLSHAQNALRIARSSGDERSCHAALVMIRDLQHKYGALDEFMRVAIDAVASSERMGDAGSMVDDLMSLSIAYERAGDTERAVDACRKALVLAHTAGKSVDPVQVTLRLLGLLVKAGHTREVIKNTDEAIRTLIDPKDSVATASIRILQGEALLAEGKAVDALPLLVSSERVLAEAGSAAERLHVWSVLALTYHALSDRASARRFTDQAMKIAVAVGDHGRTIELFKLSSRLHEADGDLALALLAERHQDALEDSLLDRSIADRAAGIKELYSTGKIGRELEELRSRNERNESTIASARASGRLWLAAFAILAVLLSWAAWSLIARRRVAKRIRLKNMVIRQQAEQINASNLELERQNRRLTEALMGEEEKGSRLREIHHRMKNNLQMVNSLLRMQFDSIDDPAVADVMREAQHRVRAMAMVHENIYRRGDLAKIDLRPHLKELCESVLITAGAPGRVRLDLRVAQELLPIDTVLPLSLLLNELLMNTLKHGFPGGRTGSINIHLGRGTDGGCELYYHDDGVGLEPTMVSKSTFGMSLIRSLVEQLDGTMRLVAGDGTTIIIGFPVVEKVLRKAG